MTDSPLTTHHSPLTTHHSRLTHWQRWLVFLFFAVVVLFGDLVELRSVFLKRHMTDLQVYLRTAWAVRSGTDIYQIEDDNHWHYHYPPLLAVLLAPLADAPADVDRTGLLPFGVSVSLWYKFNVACLLLAVHWLASALEQTASDPAVRGQPRGCQRWWALRMAPMLVCLPGIGHTLMRGQVNLLLLAILCGMIAAALRGQRWRAGLWLAGAICLKIIPAFLVIYPLWRRNRRWLAGCTLGLVIGLAIIPALVLGPRQTWAYAEEWTNVLARPAFGAGTDQSRARELIEATATDSQSLQVALHNALHLNDDPRPPQPELGVRIAHWLLSGLLTLVTFSVAVRQRREDGPATVMVVGAFILVMVLTSPVCHIHYFCLALPLVMGMLAARWEQSGKPQLGPGMILLFTVYIAGNVLLSLPGLRVLRDLGLAGQANLLLWVVGCAMLWKRGKAQEVRNQRQDDMAIAA